MKSPYRRLAVAILVALAASTLIAQRGGLTPDQATRRRDLEKELQSIAVVERKVMMPMRDGVRLATDIYRPKDTSKKVPIVWVRTPYNFNYWDVRNRVPSDMTAALNAVKRGYAYVVQNERGHFFSEGNYDILGPPISDGDDALTWMARQPWSNGKVGTTGCSSTAEYQMAIASVGNPAYAAMNVQGFGAGVGRVAPYFEQGNWYRGGAVQMLFITWIYGEQNQVRPMFPRDTPQQDLIDASRLFDLAPQMPPVDWSKALWHLPVQEIMTAVHSPRGIFADPMPVPTGGRMIQRTPNDLVLIVRRVIDEVEIAHPDRELELVSDGRSAMAELDADRIAQVIGNLVANAVAYGTAGSRIRIGVGGTDAEVSFAVHNTGAPIAADRLRQIFEPMQQVAPGASRGQRSVGLGLYIVESIVVSHRGTIDVVSSESGGTTFTVRIPRLGSAPPRAA